MVTLEISPDATFEPDYRWTLTCGQRSYSFRQGALQFPRWQEVVPKNTSEFSLLTPKTKLPEGKNDVVELLLFGQGVGGRDAMFVPKEDSSENTCFNAAYLRDALRHVGSKPTAHYYAVTEDPRTLRLVGASGEAIVMPMRR
jgi:hypothetical protein